MFHRSRAPYLGLNLFCMAIGMGVLVATLNPIAALIAYFVPLYICVQIDTNRK